MECLRGRYFTSIACLLLAMTASVVIPPPAGSQQAVPDSSTLTLRVNSRLTLVDVIATDAAGKPVHGLTLADFSIKEDGKPQPLRNLEEFGTQVLVPKPAPKLPPNVYTNAQAQAPTTRAVNVLLLDDVSTGLANHLQKTPVNIAYGRDAAIKYLTTMPEGTQVVVLELADRLRVIQSITSDRDVLLAAVRSIKYKTVGRTTLPPGREGPELPKVEKGQAGSLAGTHAGIPPGPEACEVVNLQSRMIVDALENAAAYLSGIKGRKNLIWFTPGIPWLTNYPQYDSVGCLNDFSVPLQRTYGLLTAAQVALYPINPGGLVACGPGDTACESGAVDDVGSLQDFATATGGTAYYNRNDLDAALGEAIATGSDYYSLSYVPPLAKYDGIYHKISVTVGRPDIHLVYREGYTSLDPAKKPEPAAKTSEKTLPSPDASLYAAMAHGAAPSTQVLFLVRVTPSAAPAHPGDPVLGHLNPNLKLKGKPLVRYDFTYVIRPDQITLTEAPDGKRQAGIEFTVAAYDGEGETVNVLRQTVSLSIAPAKLATFLQGPSSVLLQIDLPPGNLFVRTGMRDLPSNRVGTLEIPLNVGP